MSTRVRIPLSIGEANNGNGGGVDSNSGPDSGPNSGDNSDTDTDTLGIGQHSGIDATSSRRSDPQTELSVPGGSASAARAGDSTRNGSNRSANRGGGNSNRSGRKAGADSSSSKETETPDSGSVPREISISELGAESKKSKSVKLTNEFFAEGWGLLFILLAVVLKDNEWRLPDEDQSELGDRTFNWLNSLDSKKFASVTKVLGKWQPFASLLFALIAVVGVRVAHTRQKGGNHVINPPAKPPTGTGAGAATVARRSDQRTDFVQPPAQAVSSSSARTASVTEAPIMVASGAVIERPFRRDDFNELFGFTDG